MKRALEIMKEKGLLTTAENGAKIVDLRVHTLPLPLPLPLPTTTTTTTTTTKHAQILS
jgi:hypothetical protein